MFSDEDHSGRRFKVVFNHEEQYSIWPEDRENPLGWNEEGTIGTRDECLAHIDRIWIDMRPLSLRRAMDEQAKSASGQAE